MKISKSYIILFLIGSFLVLVSTQYSACLYSRFEKMDFYTVEYVGFTYLGKIIGTIGFILMFVGTLMQINAEMKQKIQRRNEPKMTMRKNKPRLRFLNIGFFINIGLSLILLTMALHSPIRVTAAGAVVTALDDGFLVRGQRPGEADVNDSIAYNNVWDANTADYAHTSYPHDIAYQICSYQSGNLAFEFSRIALFFDVSSIVANLSVASATLSVCIKSSVSDVGPYNITIQGSNVLENGLPVFPHKPLRLSDYSRFYYSGNYGSANSASFKTDHYTNITITDLSIIHPLTKMLLRLNVDIDGNHTGWTSGQSIGYTMYSSRSSYPPLLYLTFRSNYTTTTLTSTTLQISTLTASATSVSTSWSITTIPTLSTETTWVTTTTTPTTITAPATVTVTRATTTSMSNTTFSTSTTTVGGGSATSIIAPLIWAVIVATCVTVFLAIRHSRQRKLPTPEGSGLPSQLTCEPKKEKKGDR